jgi:hypothetical protein
LQAVRSGNWKLHFPHQYPDVVHRLSKLAEAMRTELGDALTNTKGKGVRAVGRSE